MIKSTKGEFNSVVGNKISVLKSMIFLYTNEHQILKFLKFYISVTKIHMLTDNLTTDVKKSYMESHSTLRESKHLKERCHSWVKRLNIIMMPILPHPPKSIYRLITVPATMPETFLEIDKHIEKCMWKCKIL